MTKYITLLIVNTVLSISIFGQFSAIKTSSELISKYKEKRNLMQQQSISAKSFALGISGYSDEQKLDSIIEFNFNETTGNWDERFTKNTYSYDNQLNEVFYLYSSWDNEKNTWQDLWKEYLAYDDKGLLIQTTAYSWAATDEWGEMYKDTFIYNAKNELIEAICHSWSNSKSKWVLTEKHVHKYDENGKKIADSTYYNYDDSENWILVEKNEYLYLNDEYLHYIYKSKWDKDKNEWLFDEKAWYLYGNIYWELVSIYHSKWDETESDWELYKLEGFGYEDTREYTTTHTITNRDVATNEWVSAYLNIYFFDYTLSFDELVLPYFFKNYEKKFYHHKPEIKELLSRNFNTNENEKFREVKYFYSPVETDVVNGLEKVTDEMVKIYPNPAKENITVNYPKISGKILFELMDLHGKKIMSKTIMNGEKVDVSCLESGIYFYRLILNEKIVRGKLIKE